MNQNMMTHDVNPNETRHEMDPLTIYDSLMYQAAYNNITPVIAPDNNVDKLINHNKLDIPKVILPIESNYANVPDHIKDEVNSASSNFNTENSDVNNLNYSQHTANISQPNQSIDNTLNNLNNYQGNYNSNVNSTYQPNGNTVNQITKMLGKGKCKVKKERSSYWSEKITDKDFPFYGCSVCNICYVDLQDLDKHIATHKDRITSYDLRVKNQLRKKKLKKEKKKLKKLSKKIKQENPTIEIEIKPEDGYIGSETASEFNNKNNGGSVNNNKSGDDKSKENDKDAKAKQDNKDLFNLEKIFKCFACQKQFMLSYYLKLHVRSHTDEKPYTCPKCGQSFITASKLGRHDKRFHLQIKYQCRICYRYFSRFEFLTAHFDKKHADDKIEGEPYDYNAILPYLKELEEELKLKSEQAKAKPKDMWSDGWSGPSFGEMQPGDIMPDATVKGESEWQEQKVEPDSAPRNHGSHFLAELEVDIKREYPAPRPEEVLLDEKPPLDAVPEAPLEAPLEVKSERPDDDPGPEDPGDDHAGDDHVKNETDSEEEYFPKNTWVETKLEEPPAPVPDKSDPLTCKVCAKKISSVSYMKIHMRTHTGEKPYKCYICKAGFITSSKMHRHVLTHPIEEREGKVKKEDGLDTSGEDEDVKPLAVVKAESKIKKRRRRTKKELAKKLKSDEDAEKEKTEKKEGRGKTRPHACEFCQQRFLHLETLEVHKKSHEGEALKCRYCLSEMDDEAALRAHELTHSGPKPYLCTICGKGYKKKETMIFHRKHHRPDSVFICNLCSKAFNERGKLQRHLLTHRREKYSLRYECPVCAHMFHTKYHVRMHLNTHQKEGLIVEENRNEILAMVLQNARKVPKANAPDVPESIPSDERSRVCNICGEVFTHFYYLEEHLKNHGSKLALEDEEEPEIKKHVCQVCNKSFKLHYYLKLHSFTHTKEKPYICQECGKGFITRGKLKRHLETHAGLKKYQCHVCYKFFTRPSYLRVHVRTIHGTQDYNFRLAQNLGHAYPRDE